MSAQQEEAQTKRRLEELAQRSERSGGCCFTSFLSPPEAEWAESAARHAGVQLWLDGGYEDAERQMACFQPMGEKRPEFPLKALELLWPHQSAPTHRDLLGSVMGLGLQRRCIGDIVVEPERAILYTEEAMAQHLCDTLLSAGKVQLQVKPLEQLPEVSPAEGKEVRDTVAGLRLDAVAAAGFNLSRAKAAELIRSGRVKLRHLPNEHTDAQVAQGDVISVRGLGRLKVQEIGSLTRKERYPLLLLRYGEKH